VARTRKRFWAKTLTLTAVLLAVVWVGSMKVALDVQLPHYRLSLSTAACTYLRVVPSQSQEPHMRIKVHTRWRAYWWFDHSVWPLPGGAQAVDWHAPLWPLVLLTGVPGVWMLVKTRQRTNPHACPTCGYDRTGLPQPPTGPAPCPECGKSA